MFMFAVYGLYFVEVCFLYAHILENLYHKRVLSFVESVFCNYGNEQIAFIHQLVDIVYHID